MTKKQLIEALEDFPDNADILVYDGETTKETICEIASNLFGNAVIYLETEA